MSSSRRSLRRSRSVGIDMAPLLDMVFILLIFFMVTTHFTRDTGLALEKPAAKTAVAVSPESIDVRISSDGVLAYKGRTIALHSLEGMIRQDLSKKSDSQVLIISDRRVSTGTLISVYDRCALGGASSISIATEMKK